MDAEWRPGNETERDMVAAVAAGDGTRFARLLMSAPLLVPVLRPPGTAAGAALMRRLPRVREHIMAFVSPESLAWSLGECAAGHRETTFTALRATGLTPRYRLAASPGTPVAVYLPVDGVLDLASGRRSALAVEDVDGAVAAALRDAVDRADDDAFLATLLGATVAVPTDESGAEPGGIPWKVVGDRDAPLIPVFSSAEALRRTCGAAQTDIGVPFLQVLADWPGPHHTLCFDPGTRTELILPGDTLLEMLAGLEGARQGGGRVT